MLTSWCQTQNEKCSLAPSCDRNTTQNTSYPFLKTNLMIESKSWNSDFLDSIGIKFELHLSLVRNFPGNRPKLWFHGILCDRWPPKQPEIQNLLFQRNLGSSEFDLSMVIPTLSTEVTLKTYCNRPTDSNESAVAF